MNSNTTKRLAIVLFLSAASFSAAIFFQEVLGAKPCPWCIFQRLIIISMMFTSLIGIMFNQHMRSKLKPVALLLTAITLSAECILGMWSAYQQHLSIKNPGSCGISFANKFLLENDFEIISQTLFQVRGDCAEAAFSLMGVPFEAVAGVFFFISLVQTLSIFRKRKSLMK